jgi:hypothetical protein
MISAATVRERLAQAFPNAHTFLKGRLMIRIQHLLVCSLFAVALALVASGCGEKKDAGKDKDKAAKDKDKDKDKDKKTPGKEDDHDEIGPHGGPLAEWDHNKYHAEFTVDREKKKTTVYILDNTAKKAAPIPADSEVKVTLTKFKPAVQITLKADPEKDDPKGKSSRFVGTHDKLADKALFEGEISGKVGDTPYVAPFVEEDKDKNDKK